MEYASKTKGKKNATLELMPDEQLPSNNNSELNQKDQPFAPSKKKKKQEVSRAIAESGLLAHAPAIASNDVESAARAPTTNHYHQEPFMPPGAYRSDGGYDPRHHDEEDMYTITNMDHQQAAAPLPTAAVHVQARLVPDEAPDGATPSSFKHPNDGFPVVVAAEQRSWMNKIPLGAWLFAGILVLAIVIGVVVAVVTMSGGGDPSEPATSNDAENVPSRTPAASTILLPSIQPTSSPTTAFPTPMPSSKPTTAPPTPFPTSTPTTMSPTPLSTFKPTAVPLTLLPTFKSTTEPPTPFPTSTLTVEST